MGEADPISTKKAACKLLRPPRTKNKTETIANCLKGAVKLIVFLTFSKDKVRIK